MSRYRLSDGVLRAEVDGDEVLLNPTTGVYHLLNPTGRDLLDRLDGGATLDEAVAALAAARGAEVSTVRADSESFIRDMVDRRLLEVVS